MTTTFQKLRKKMIGERNEDEKVDEAKKIFKVKMFYYSAIKKPLHSYF